MAENEKTEKEKALEQQLKELKLENGVLEAEKLIAEAKQEKIKAQFPSGEAQPVEGTMTTNAKAGYVASLAAYHAMIKNAQTLLVDKERVQIAVKIDGLLKATDMALKLQKNTGIAVFTAVSNALNPGAPANINAYMSQLAAQEPQMRKNIEQLLQLTQYIQMIIRNELISVLSLVSSKCFS